MAKSLRKKQQDLRRLLLVVALFIVLFIAGLAFINSYSKPVWSLETAVADKNSRLNGSKDEFITTLAPVAQHNQARYGVLASISLAQAILESDWGQSDLAVNHNNLYGIKGSGDDPLYPTQEYLNGEYVTVQAPFRSYSSFGESMADHSKLLIRGIDGNSQLYQGVIDADHYIQAAYALQEAGYATDPNYAEKLIALIDQYHLYSYDL